MKRLGILLAVLTVASAACIRITLSKRAECDIEARTTAVPDPADSVLPLSDAHLVRSGAGVVSVLDVPPEQMRAVLDDGYRLVPDKRFLAAIAELHQWISGEAAGEMQIAFEGDRWVIHYRGERVGELPELPDYTDATELLLDWQDRLRGRWPIDLQPHAGADSAARDVLARWKELLPAEIAAGIEEVDERWHRGTRTPALVRAAAHGLVLLQLQSPDRLEITDRLSAKALAAITLAKVGGPELVRRDEALLAHLLGYSTAAAELGSSLPPKDAVRLFVTRETDALRAIAEGSPDVLTQYLYVLRLAEDYDFERWIAWMSEHYTPKHLDLPVVAAALELKQFETDRAFSMILPYLALFELWETTGSAPVSRAVVRQVMDTIGQHGLLGLTALNELMRLDPTDVLHRFESGVTPLTDRLQGPFLDAETYRSFLSGHVYGGVYTLSLHILDGLSSTGGAQDLVRALASAPAGLGCELHAWYSDLTDSKAGHKNVVLLGNDLSQLRLLGVPPLLRTHEEIAHNREYTDPFVIASTKRLARRMDTRMSHQLHLGNLLYSELRDLPRADKYYRSVLAKARSEYPDLQSWYARFSGNVRGMRAIVADTTLPTWVRVGAIQHLAGDSPEHLTRTLYRRLIDERPADWEVRNAYIRHLEDRGDYEEAEDVAGQWLQMEEVGSGFDYIFARTALARIYQAQGYPRDAWEMIQPVIASGQAGAMGRGALILQDLGHTEDAAQLAHQLVARYGDVAWARATLAEILWHQRQYDDAAQALSPGRGFHTGAWGWRDTIAKGFIRAFTDGSVPEIRAAVSALMNARVAPTSLRELGVGAASAGRNDLAFHTLSILPVSGDPGVLEIPVLAATALEEWKGRSEALEWLRLVIPPEWRNRSSLAIYRDRRFDLLWDFIERPEDGDHPSSVWLMRAAAWVASGMPSDPRQQALARYYARSNPDDPYFLMGRYLVGLEDDRALLRIATAPDRRCEIAYYLGLRAWSERRYEDASDWFRVVLETGQRREGEYVWAMDALDRWAGTRKQLRQAAEGRI